MLQISRFSILCLLLLIFGCESKNSSAKEYVIKGQAEGIYNGVRVYLKTSEGGQNSRVTDTAIVVNEFFEFKGTIEGPSNAYFNGQWDCWTNCFGFRAWRDPGRYLQGQHL